MRAKARRVGVLLVLTCLLIFGSGTPPLIAAFSDTRGHWASTAIESLAARGIIGGYSDNTFHPDRPITRGEFAEIVVEAFSIPQAEEPVFADTADHPAARSIAGLAAAGYVSENPVGSFRPDDAITRAEAARIMALVLDVADIDWFTDGEPSHFDDLSSDHWAYSSAQALESLGVLPVFTGTEFEPTTSLTRAEAAWLIYQGTRLTRENGTVTYVDAPTSRITLQTQQGRIRDIRTEPDTLIVREDSLESLDGLTAGDSVFIVSDRFGTPKLVVASGGAASASEDLTERMATLILEVFTVEELQQMIAGDWSVATDGLQREVRERLTEAGITEPESQALLNGDWQTLQQSVTDRLQEELAARLSISEELANALIQRDWTTVRDQAQLELAEHLLNRLLATMDNSAQA